MTHVTWAKGGTAVFVTVVDDAVTLRSSIPSPPGSRLEGELVAPSASGARVRMKVHGSKREDDGSFTLRGRLLDANRELREVIAALTRTSEPG